MESSDHTFPRAERLRSRKQIARLFEKGESGVVYPIRYVFLTGEDDAGDATDEGGLSVLVSVSKRNHKRANVRNLLKRRIREAYRLRTVQPGPVVCFQRDSRLYVDRKCRAEDHPEPFRKDLRGLF